MPQSFAAAVNVISLLRYACFSSSKSSGKVRGFRPKRTPLALRLPLPDVFPLCLGHIAEQLEYDVRNERPGQVASMPGVQQWHIQHHNGRFLPFCDDAPLLQDFTIAPAQPVAAFDHQYISRLQAFHQTLVAGRRESLPDSFSPMMISSSTPNSRIAVSWRALFCSCVDTRTYPYCFFHMRWPLSFGEIQCSYFTEKEAFQI